MTTTLQLGDITLHRIIEQESAFTSATDMLPGLTPALLAENRSWMREAGALDAEDRLVLCFQSYVVRTPHHVILIDSCIGNDKERPTRPNWHRKTDIAFIDGLAAIGLSVADIDVVMCTHLHADHVGWNTKLVDGRWVPTFPNARYVFGAREFEVWTGLNAKAEVPPFVDSVLPVVAANRADLVASDYALGDHVRLLSTPGHTLGHVAIELGQGRAAAVMTGDLIHTPLQAWLTELSTKFDMDMAMAATTRRKFLETYCDTETLCCTAHFPSPSMGWLKRWGDGFRCDPVS